MKVGSSQCALSGRDTELATPSRDPAKAAFGSGLSPLGIGVVRGAVEVWLCPQHTQTQRHRHGQTDTDTDIDTDTDTDTETETDTDTDIATDRHRHRDLSLIHI